MKKSIFFKLAFAIAVISGCKQDLDFSLNDGVPPGPVKISQFDSANLETILIPAGRGFLYKDSASGNEDSVFTVQSIIYPMQAFDINGYPVTKWDVFSLTFSTKINGNLKSVWFGGSATCDINPNSNEVLIDSIFTLSNEQTGIPAYWYPFTSTVTNQYSLIPAIEIEGIKYTDVHRFLATNGMPVSDINYLSTVFYWVKGVGIIKRETHNAHSTKTDLLVKYW